MEELPDGAAPANQVEASVLTALRSWRIELAAREVLDYAESLCERRAISFRRRVGSAYLAKLVELGVVDGVISARQLGARMYRLRDPYRPET